MYVCTFILNFIIEKLTIRELDIIEVVIVSLLSNLRKIIKGSKKRSKQFLNDYRVYCGKWIWYIGMCLMSSAVDFGPNVDFAFDIEHTEKFFISFKTLAKFKSRWISNFNNI